MGLLTTAVREALGAEAADLGLARKRLEVDRARVQTSIANLLDNITAATRDLVEQRLGQLRVEHTRLEARAEELDRLAGEEGKVQETILELGRFLAGLEFTLNHGVGVEKMAALRRCVVKVTVEAQAGRTVLGLRVLPAVGAGERAKDGMVEVGVKLDAK
jgi:hypothetical protein